MSTKTRNILIGVVGVLLLVGIVFGCIALFGGEKFTEKATQYVEFSNRTVFPQGTSTLSDDGVIRLDGGKENKIDIVVEAPSNGLYKMYLNNCMLSLSQFDVYVTSSAWNDANAFVSNVEDGEKYDAQGFSERGFTVYLSKGRNVISIWTTGSKSLEIMDLKYKLYNFDTDIKINDPTYTQGENEHTTTGSLQGTETYRLGSGDEVFSTFMVNDAGVYSVGIFAGLGVNSTVSIEIYNDDSGDKVGSFEMSECKDYLVINSRDSGTACCSFLDFGNDFEVELDEGTYNFVVTTSGWLTYSGAILDRVGPLDAEK